MHMELREINSVIGGRSTNRQNDSIHSLCTMIELAKKEQQSSINELRTLTRSSK